MLKWTRFVWERFSPLTHGPMILLFAWSHAVRQTAPFDARWGMVLGFLVLFFFKMRLYDEIKDFATDQVLNPGRPLPRGLLRPRDLVYAIALCLVLEVLLVVRLDSALLPGAAGVMLYSLLMYKEFFVGKWLRPLLTTYAVTHTVVVVGLSLLASALLSSHPGRGLVMSDVYYAAGCWALFNVFEFGRKTFAPVEERPGVASYSLVWGRWGAVALNLSQALVALLCWSRVMALQGNLALYFALGFLSLAGTGLYFAIRSSREVALLYRGVSGAYILWCFGWFFFAPELL